MREELRAFLAALSASLDAGRDDAAFLEGLGRECRNHLLPL